MHYTDPVYGVFDITEPVVVDLLASPSMVRLQDVDSGGYSRPFFRRGFPHSRFEHCVGVYLLLYRYKAPLAEQVAGLLHDVSHSAFSHCIDYALDQGSEKEHTHQDNVFESFVRTSEIPSILKKHGLDVDYILNDRNFSLKETLLPDLCADRIDYCLRNAVLRGGMTKQEIQSDVLQHLRAENQKWVFEDFESAKRFAHIFLKFNTEIWAGIGSAVMFRTVGDVLRHALQYGYVTEADLYTTDTVVLTKIRSYLAADAELQRLYDRMDGKIGFTNNPKEYNAHVWCKSRVVDPLCMDHGVVRRMSEVDPTWREVVQRESQPKEYFIKFER